MLKAKKNGSYRGKIHESCVQGKNKPIKPKDVQLHNSATVQILGNPVSSILNWKAYINKIKENAQLNFYECCNRCTIEDQTRILQVLDSSSAVVWIRLHNDI